MKNDDQHQQPRHLRLNARALTLCQRLVDDAEMHGVRVDIAKCGTRLIDCGVNGRGSLRAGLMLAEICTAGLADVCVVPSDTAVWSGAAIQVTTDAPLQACMASQYAGWAVTGADYFAMGSGPMRAAAGREDLFDKIGNRETADATIGVLETRQLPPDEVCQKIAADCDVAADHLTLLIAPTASVAGTLQIVARSVETAMHKLFELGFDLRQIQCGYGTAPLPPVAKKDLQGIGRTNDAILYGGQVTLWLRGDDQTLQELVARVPSCTSKDYGRPFLEIFEQNNRDFYAIDPHLFSPAVVRLINLESGNSFVAGELRADVIAHSFGVRPVGIARS